MTITFWKPFLGLRIHVCTHLWYYYKFFTSYCVPDLWRSVFYVSFRYQLHLLNRCVVYQSQVHDVEYFFLSSTFLSVMIRSITFITPFIFWCLTSSFVSSYLSWYKCNTKCKIDLAYTFCAIASVDGIHVASISTSWNIFAFSRLHSFVITAIYMYVNHLKVVSKLGCSLNFSTSTCMYEIIFLKTSGERHRMSSKWWLWTIASGSQQCWL